MERIRTEWASLIPADNGSVIVCVKDNGGPRCICFASLKQVEESIEHKKLLVKRWAIAVPRKVCILKSLSLPASDLSEAVRMTGFELPSLVPLSPEEIVYGCSLLNKQDNTLKVLVCILKLKTLNQHLERYSSAGIQPYRVELDSLAIHSWFNSMNNRQTSPEIDVLVNGSRCIILQSSEGNFQTAAELNHSAAESARGIMREISNQQKHLSDGSQTKARILLAGTRHRVQELKGLLDSVSGDSAIVNKPSVVTGPQISYYSNDNRTRHQDSFNYETVAAAGLLELAVSYRHPESNLLPQKILRLYERKSRLLNYMFSCSLFLLAGLLLWLCLVALNWRITRACQPIESQIAPIQDIARSVETKRQRVAAIQEQLSNRGRITQLFEELYKYSPRSISISELKFVSKSGGTTVDIKGQANMLSDAFDYTDAMAKAALLNKLQIENAQQVPRPGGSVVEFKAHCVIPE